ncbi:hypothetical protein HMPREF9080_02578 [Cardiobacterium valvarum F0432]|uniref:Insertion element IS402-like domain-containing protein n=1 Tax=Cardiobacterium valvarum F0432 TaxID=797473 RepID=G9ZIG7_9GAMM|nr:hypothetical protein HMPREF9080_02578 [Cardiobacterium valvarum F0432]
MEGRLILTDAQWAKIEPLCTGKANDRGPTADNRMFIEAVLWIARTGSPWRDLPKEFQRVPALPPLEQSGALCQNL